MNLVIPQQPLYQDVKKKQRKEKNNYQTFQFAISNNTLERNS